MPPPGSGAAGPHRGSASICSLPGGRDCMERWVTTWTQARGPENAIGSAARGTCDTKSGSQSVFFSTITHRLPPSLSHTSGCRNEVEKGLICDTQCGQPRAPRESP